MGQYLSRLSKIIKHGKIVSIEPVPYNILALFRMKSLLKIKNAIIRRFACDFINYRPKSMVV